jgi:hypothetical protein
MLTMAVGHSDDVDPLDAIAAVIDQCRASLGDRQPQAGILLTAFDSFDRTVVEAIRTAFPGVSVMGSTSSAEVSSVGGFLEDSITLALFGADDADITTGLGTGLGIDVDRACRQAAAQALTATRREPRVCVVLAEGFAADPQVTLEAMARALPDGVVIVGGGSARRNLGMLTPTYQFRDELVSEDGVAVILFSGAIAHSIAVGTGFRPLGATGTVTDAERGLVRTIDGRPATEFLAPYLDVTGPASFGNPLAVVERGAERSYLRAIIGSDPMTGAVSLFGSVPVGATVQLTTTNPEDILAGTRDALARVSADFPAGARPEAALIFSCMVRKFLLGTRTRVEAEMARDQLGAAIPMAGLYCAGEIGPVPGVGASRFLNETFVTLLLGT